MHQSVDGGTNRLQGRCCDWYSSQLELAGLIGRKCYIKISCDCGKGTVHMTDTVVRVLWRSPCVRRWRRCNEGQQTKTTTTTTNGNEMTMTTEGIGPKEGAQHRLAECESAYANFEHTAKPLTRKSIG